MPMKHLDLFSFKGPIKVGLECETEKAKHISK